MVADNGNKKYMCVIYGLLLLIQSRHKLKEACLYMRASREKLSGKQNFKRLERINACRSIFVCIFTETTLI